MYSVPGVADDSGLWRADDGVSRPSSIPVALYNLTTCRSCRCSRRWNANNSNTGGGFYTQGGHPYGVRGLGLVKSTEDIGEVVVGSSSGVAIRIKDIGRVEIGHAPLPRHPRPPDQAEEG